MVRATFFEGSLKGFEIKGHANAGTYGSDIVCAAVSSAALMAANTVSEILSIDADAQMDEGYLRFTFSSDNACAKAIIDGLKLHLTELQKEYPNKIKVITEV